MEQELTFRIILESPPPGVDFGLQKGRGNEFEVVQKQRSGKGDLSFEFDSRVKEGKDGSPTLLDRLYRDRRRSDLFTSASELSRGRLIRRGVVV